MVVTSEALVALWLSCSGIAHINVDQVSTVMAEHL